MKLEMRTRRHGGVRSRPSGSEKTGKDASVSDSKSYSDSYSEFYPETYPDSFLTEPKVSQKKVSKAKGVFAQMGIKASLKNTRAFLESVDSSKLPRSAKTLKSRYNTKVANSIKALRQASKLDTITEEYRRRFSANYSKRRSAAVRSLSFKNISKTLRRKSPQEASYFLSYINDNFVINPNFQPILTHVGNPTITYDTEDKLIIRGRTKKDSGNIEKFQEATKKKILAFLASQANKPSFYEFVTPGYELKEPFEDEEEEYLAKGIVYLSVNRYSSPLANVVRDSYESKILSDLPIYFVFQTPKALIEAHNSHVSILVLHNSTWYSIGLGFSDENAALYNPDHVISITGMNSSKIPFHLRLIDVGIFYKKHYDRILALVQKGKYINPVELDFGSSFGPGGLSSQIIKLNMPYKYVTCANSDPSTLNCTSFAQYVFRERIDCQTIMMIGYVHPSLCKRKKHPITMRKLEIFIQEYSGVTEMSPKTFEDLTWEIV